IELGVELGEPAAVDAAGEGIAAGLERPPLEAAEPEQRVLRPADRLAELAVADDVEPDRGLPAHHLGDRVLQAFGIGRGVERPAGFLGGEEFAQRRWADQAADMRGQDASRAALHLSSPALAAGIRRAGRPQEGIARLQKTTARARGPALASLVMRLS